MQVVLVSVAQLVGMLSCTPKCGGLIPSQVQTPVGVHAESNQLVFVSHINVVFISLSLFLSFSLSFLPSPLSKKRDRYKLRIEQ